MKRPAILLAVLAVTLIYLAAIFPRSLWPSDEPRYGEIAREMIASGDWVTPRLNGLLYFEKPVMGHWLNAASLTLFGETPFAVRFSSALALLATSLVIWMWGSRLEGDPRLGRWAALMYVTSGLPFAVGTWAVLDGPLTFFTTLAVAAGYFAFNSGGRMQKCSWLALLGAATGAAFLTKGLPGILVPGLTVGGYLIVSRKWREILVAPWLPLLAFAVVVAPWSIAIHRAQPDFWRYFIVVEHIGRFLDPHTDQHEEPFWFFLPVLFGGMSPWIVLLPLFFADWKRRFREIWARPWVKYTLVGSALIFLFMSASGGKLAPYILPVIPMLTLFLAWNLIAYFDAGKSLLYNWYCRILAIVVAAGVALFAVYQMLCDLGVIPAKAALYAPTETLTVILAAAALLALAGSLALAARSIVPGKKFGWFAAGVLITFGCVHFVIPQRFALPMSPVLFYEQFRDRVDADTILVGFKEQIAPMCWTFKRDDVRVYEFNWEMMYGLEHAEPGRLLRVDGDAGVNEFFDLIADPPARVVIGMRHKRRAAALPESPFRRYQHGILYQEYDVQKR